MKYETKAIHAGRIEEPTNGVNVPIYTSSTFLQPGFKEYGEYAYSRGANPTRKHVEQLVAELEGANYGFATATGMAAIALVFGLFKTGDKIILNSNIYGGTYRFVSGIFDTHGIAYEMVDDINTLDLANLDENVKGIFVETPSNPLLDVIDLKRIGDYTKQNDICFIVDNTFLTSYFQRPLDFGADIVVYSATKYYGGHSDLLAGLVVLNDQVLYERLKFLHNTYGGILSPFEAYLLSRGIKTLPLRLQKHEENTKQLVAFLKAAQVAKELYYPGDEGHPDYALQKQQASGSGAVFSLRLKDEYDVATFVDALKVFGLAVSLGGVESLICHPATMTHESYPQALQEKIGIHDDVLRFAVGIENIEDLIADIEQALEKAYKGEK